MAASTSSRFPRSHSALLIGDVINPLDFPGGHALAPKAAKTARRIAALASRARRTGVPVVLHAMLQLGRVRSVVVTGLLTGNCVLFTAADAYMRNYEVIIPSDCVIDRTRRHQQIALATMQDVLKARVVRSRLLRLRR